MVAEAEELRQNVEKQEVHKSREHYRRVYSSIGLYSPSYTYLGLDFSLMVADFAMEGSYSPSLTFMPWGFSHNCIVLPLGVLFGLCLRSLQLLAYPLEHALLLENRVTPRQQRKNSAALFFFFFLVK